MVTVCATGGKLVPVSATAGWSAAIITVMNAKTLTLAQKIVLSAATPIVIQAKNGSVVSIADHSDQKVHHETNQSSNLLAGGDSAVGEL